MTRIILCLACLALSGCGILRQASPFARGVPETPLPYAARIDVARGAAEFAVRVRTNGAPFALWRESARYPGTRHCLRNFGSSRIDWQSGPGGPDDWLMRVSADGTAVVQGRCASR